MSAEATTRHPAYRTALWQGVLGSALLTVASWGIGFLPGGPHSLFTRTTLLVPFRVPTGSVLACAALGALGILVLIRAWLLLGRLAVRSPDAAPEPERARMVGRVVAAWSAPLLVALPVFSQDVYSYAAQGRLMALGGDPYKDWVSQLPGWLGEGSDVLWAQSSSPYGPLFLALAQAVYVLCGGVPELNVLLFRLLGLAGTWLTLVAVAKLCARRGVDAGWGSWVVVANPLWLLSMVASAHNDSLMIGLLLLGFLAALRGRWIPALLAVSAAIAVKPIVVLALPFVGLALAGRRAGRGKRFAAWTVTAVAVGAVMTLLGAITGLWFGWIQAMADQGGAAQPWAPWGLVGVATDAIASAFGAPPGVARSVVSAAGKVIAIGLTVWLALRRPTAHPLAACGLALIAAVVLSPTIQPWYALWILPLLTVWRAWYGAWEQLVIYASAVTALVGFVWMLSIPEWVPSPLAYAAAAVAALLGLSALRWGSGHTRAVLAGFRFSGLREHAQLSVLTRDPLTPRPAVLARLTPSVPDRDRTPTRKATVQ